MLPYSSLYVFLNLQGNGVWLLISRSIIYPPTVFDLQIVCFHLYVCRPKKDKGNLLTSGPFSVRQRFTLLSRLRSCSRIWRPTIRRFNKHCTSLESALMDRQCWETQQNFTSSLINILRCTFLRGGSTVPPFVLTERFLTLFADMSTTDMTGTGGSENPSASVSQASASLFQAQSASVSQAQTFTVTSRRLSASCHRFQHKPKAIPSNPTNNLLSFMIKLQTRHIQLERQRIRIEREKVQSLNAIHEELTTIRATLCHCYGVTLEPITLVASAEEEWMRYHPLFSLVCTVWLDIKYPWH